MTRIVVSLREVVEFLRQNTMAEFDNHHFLKTMLVEVFSTALMGQHLQLMIQAGIEPDRARWLSLTAFNMTIDAVSEFLPGICFNQSQIDSMEFLNDFDLILIPRIDNAIDSADGRSGAGI